MQLVVLAQCWLKQLALRRHARQVCLLSEVQGPNTTSLTSVGYNLIFPHPMILKAVQKNSLTLKRHIETVPALQGIFPET